MLNLWNLILNYILEFKYSSFCMISTLFYSLKIDSNIYYICEHPLFMQILTQIVHLGYLQLDFNEVEDWSEFDLIFLNRNVLTPVYPGHTLQTRIPYLHGISHILMDQFLSVFDFVEFRLFFNFACVQL